MEAKVIIHPAAISVYIEQSWNFSYQNLLYRYLLNEDEIELFRDQLDRLFHSISAKDFSEKVDNYFDVFCARIVELKLQRERSGQKLLLMIEEIISELIRTNNAVDESNIGIETINKKMI